MLNRIKKTLVLTPGVYLIVLWVLALSDSPQLETTGVFQLALWGLLLSFGAAYSITLYLSMLKDGQKE